MSVSISHQDDGGPGEETEREPARLAIVPACIFARKHETIPPKGRLLERDPMLGLIERVFFLIHSNIDE